jgi:tRNA-dependent cyclodipeptide synthase
MSPGNSYFKDEEVRYLLSSVVGEYGRTVILIADIPAISTYVALGYPQNRARRDKALPQGNNLKNRTKRIAVELGYSDEQVRIIDWETEIENNPEYQKAYMKVEALYKANSQFEEIADTTTKGVLEYSGKKIEDMDAAAKIAVHYLLSEIAFLEFAPEFLSTEKVAYVYHKNWPVYEDYIAGKFDNQPKPYMDFILLENPYETYNSMWAEDDISSTDALEHVSKTGFIRAAFFNYDPAFIYEKTTNTFSGIFYEVISEIAKRNNWEIRWKEETGYGVIVDGLKAGRFDVFASTAWPTPERLKEADFSTPLYMSKVFAWVKEDIDPNNSSIRIAIKGGDISDSIATSDFPNARLVRVPQLADPSELLKFVAEDKADLTFAEPYLVEQFNKISNVKLRKLSDQPIREFGNTFMIRKNDTEFKNLLDKDIQDLIDLGFVKTLIEKYTGNGDTFS